MTLTISPPVVFGWMSEPSGVHFLAGALRDPRAYYDARDLRKSVLALKPAGEAIAEDLGKDYAISLPKAEAMYRSSTARTTVFVLASHLRRPRKKQQNESKLSPMTMPPADRTSSTLPVS